MSEVGLLGELLLLVGLAIPIVALAHRVGAPPLIGLIAAGLIVGPHGFGLIDGAEEVEALSELGVALLLFAIGLELSLSHVRRWARAVFLGGGLQVGATLGVVAAAALLLGLPFGQAVFYGALVAMSSTAIVTRAYADRGDLDTRHGRSVISILLFQDLCILPLMLLLPLLARSDGPQVVAATGELARGLAVMVALVAGGQFVVRWTLDRVVLFRDRDLFTLCVGFFGLAAALITSAAGFSIAIGAFIAGLIILRVGVRAAGVVGRAAVPRALQRHLLHVGRHAAGHPGGARADRAPAAADRGARAPQGDAPSRAPCWRWAACGRRPSSAGSAWRRWASSRSCSRPRGSRSACSGRATISSF